MAYSDLHPRTHAFTHVLRRMADAISLRRPSGAGRRAAAGESCPARLAPAAMHDIGACPAYRDYASPLTLGAGSQSRMRDLSDVGFWRMR